MYVKSLINTEGDAATDAALNDLGMWKEVSTPNGVQIRFVDTSGEPLPPLPRTTEECAQLFVEAMTDEVMRMENRIIALFPNMPDAAVTDMAESIVDFATFEQVPS